MAAVSIVKNATKVLIGGGAVYATVQQGVWSTDTNQGSKVLTSVRSTVAPTATEYFAKIPTTQEMNTSVVSVWNKGVTSTFNTLANTPEYGKKALESTKKMLTK